MSAPPEPDRALPYIVLGFVSLAVAVVLTMPFVVGAGYLGFCELHAARRGAALESTLRQSHTDAEVLGSAHGEFSGGSCCSFIVAAIAVVPDGRVPPPGADVVRRWRDAHGETWLSINHNDDLGTYEWSCHSCGPQQYKDAFEGVRDERAVVWALQEDGICFD